MMTVLSMMKILMIVRALVMRKVCFILIGKVFFSFPYVYLFIIELGSDRDPEWKPSKYSEYFDETDDDSSDDSDIDLVKQDATEFIKGSIAKNHGSTIKKFNLDEKDDE